MNIQHSYTYKIDVLNALSMAHSIGNVQKLITANSITVSVCLDDTEIGLSGRILFAISMNHSPIVAALNISTVFSINSFRV